MCNFLWRIATVGAWAALTGVAAPASELDDLVHALASDNETARVEARQLLPRQGAEAVPKLMPLLIHQDQRIWRPAFNVVADIANEVSVPGREGERTMITTSLMALLDAGQPYHIKARALRLLPLAVPEGADLSPITALLDDPELREKARAALLEMGTAEARGALRAALDDAPPEFTCALLDALGELRDEKALPQALERTNHADAHVRAAALRALAWTGNPRYERAARAVCATAGPDTERAATDALLRFADAMAAKGGNWNRAIQLYYDVLEDTEDSTLKSAAIMGLARFGDETVIPPIIEATANAEPRLKTVVVHAFKCLGGRAAAKHMAAAYPRLAPNIQRALLDVFARKHEPLLLPILLDAARDEDADFRRAGLEALGEARQLEGMTVLAEAARSASDDEKELALASAWRLADALRGAANAPAAGSAYLTLYGLARDDAERRRALEGIAACPASEAYDALMAALQEPALVQEAVKAMMAVAETLAASGQSKPALAAYEAIHAVDDSVATTAAIGPRMEALGAAVSGAEMLGLVTTWHVVGPIAWDTDADWAKPLVGEPDIDLGAAYVSRNREVAWQPYKTHSDIGIVDLIPLLGAAEWCFAYAYTEIAVEQDVDAVIRLGSDDGNQVWVNGEVVAENRVDRALAVDQDAVNVRLHAGTNTILLKISQGGGGWCFCVRLTDPSGAALTFDELAVP
ncbi:MAG TPA: hypothetical protein HPP83_04995 [Candidatus Hydrogenedentes bacterium]|nr:hypothetical protein [Candidatus Hydrogenedentota bacterium]